MVPIPLTQELSYVRVMPRSARRSPRKPHAMNRSLRLEGHARSVNQWIRPAPVAGILGNGTLRVFAFVNLLTAKHLKRNEGSLMLAILKRSKAVGRSGKRVAAATALVIGLALAGCSSKNSTPTSVSSVPAIDATVTTTSLVEVAGSRLSWPPLKVGDRSDRVKVLQYLLSANKVAITADGRFGPKTKVAINAFQTQKSLVVSETMNDETWLALATTVTDTSSADQIRALQVALTISGYPAKVTGVYDQALTDLITKSRADSGSPSLGQPTVNDWLTLLGIGD